MIPYILNLTDLAFTLYAINHGGVELNPFMQCVPIMVGYKIIVVGALCLWLKRFAEGGNTIARYGMRVITLVYGALCIYHAMFLF